MTPWADFNMSTSMRNATVTVGKPHLKGTGTITTMTMPHKRPYNPTPTLKAVPRHKPFNRDVMTTKTTVLRVLLAVALTFIAVSAMSQDKSEDYAEPSVADFFNEVFPIKGYADTLTMRHWNNGTTPDSLRGYQITLTDTQTCPKAIRNTGKRLNASWGW